MSDASLQTALLLGLSWAGVAALARALPVWPAAWRIRKPLSCDVCMGFWSAALTLAIAYRWDYSLWPHVAEVGAGYAVAVMALRWLRTSGPAPLGDLLSLGGTEKEEN
ncbi:MAG: hypothetical protein ABIK89_05000 [Planctomycetota bacterium]